jgi:RNA polymerase sigma-70 factor (ECF subfamily)
MSCCVAQPARSRFEAALIAITPELQRFARSLVGDPSQADDLVQETITRAIANRERFREGTNLRAWAFTILRNFHYAQWHKLKRFSEWDPALEDSLPAEGGQEASALLSELYEAFAELPRLQRQALTLVAVAGCTYEEAAELGQCPVGTMKSRVSRARAALDGGNGQRRPNAQADGFGAFLADCDALVNGLDRRSAA